MVLGGLVAGPALAIMGFIVGAQCSKIKDEAYSNLAQATRYSEEMDAAVDLCQAIAKRSFQFNELLSRLEKYFNVAIGQMQQAIGEHGNDFRSFSEQQKESVLASISLAKAIKTVLDTPILTKSGNLTLQSERLLQTMNAASISEKGIDASEASYNSPVSQKVVPDTVPDIASIVRSCCDAISKECWGDAHDTYETEMCRVRWADLVRCLNSNYHLDLTSNEYSAVIYRFGDPEVGYQSLLSDCRRAIFLAQASDIVASCFTRREVNPMYLTENDIDTDVLIYKIRKAYGISVKALEIFDGGSSQRLSLNKLVGIITEKVPECQMILSQNQLNFIVNQ